MRQWFLPPELLCRKHLLGEHVEIHMFEGTILRGCNISGYLKKGLLYAPSLLLRHEDIVAEMLRRGYNHNSPSRFDQLGELPDWHNVDMIYNLDDLIKRSKETNKCTKSSPCWDRIEERECELGSRLLLEQEIIEYSDRYF